MRFTRPEIGSAVRVAGRRAVVRAAWDGRGGPRNVLVEFVGTLLPEKWVVHVSRIRYEREPQVAAATPSGADPISPAATAEPGSRS